MRLIKMGDQLAQASSTYRMVKFFGSIGLFITGCFALGTQMFTRGKYGERYGSVLNLLLGLMSVSMFAGIGDAVIGGLMKEGSSNLMQTIYFCAFFLCVFHQIVIRRRNRQGIIWHSMYSGESHLSFTGISEGTLKRWVEPILLLMLSYLMRHYNQTAVGLWLEIGAISTFIHETLQEHMERAEVLDKRDAWIEANYKNEAIAGKAGQKHSFSMSRSSVAHIKQTPEELGEFSDQVRGIIDQEKAS